jgi:hypothetical protein
LGKFCAATSPPMYLYSFQIFRMSGSATGKEKNISFSVSGFAAWDL